MTLLITQLPHSLVSPPLWTNIKSIPWLFLRPSLYIKLQWFSSSHNLMRDNIYWQKNPSWRRPSNCSYLENLIFLKTFTTLTAIETADFYVVIRFVLVDRCWKVMQCKKERNKGKTEKNERERFDGRKFSSYSLVTIRYKPQYIQR